MFVLVLYLLCLTCMSNYEAHSLHGAGKVPLKILICPLS